MHKDTDLKQGSDTHSYIYTYFWCRFVSGSGVLVWERCGSAPGFGFRSGGLCFLVWVGGFGPAASACTAGAGHRATAPGFSLPIPQPARKRAQEGRDGEQAVAYHVLPKGSRMICWSLSSRVTRFLSSTDSRLGARWYTNTDACDQRKGALWVRRGDALKVMFFWFCRFTFRFLARLLGPCGK